MWTGDTMITNPNAYDLIVAILNAIGVYNIILGFFQAQGMEYVLRIVIVLVEVAVVLVFALVTVMFL